MGGVDWNWMSRIAETLFFVATIFVPGGPEAKGGEAVAAAAISAGAARSAASRAAADLGSEASIQTLTIHVAERHLAGGVATAGKSLFTQGTTVGGVARMIKQAMSMEKGVKQGTDTVFEHDFGHTIGTDPQGNATSVLRAIFDGSGRLKSAYPIPK